MIYSMKIIMVLFVAFFLETHVLVIAPLAISLGSYDGGHSKAVAYHTRLPRLR
jgi:hypothetical protein